MKGLSSGVSGTQRGPLHLRSMCFAVGGTLVVVTLVWMTSIGLLRQPRFSLVQVQSKFFDAENLLADPGTQLRITATAGETPTDVVGSAEQEQDKEPDHADSGNAPDSFINETMSRLEILVQQRLANADLYKRRLNETVYQTDELDRSYVTHVIIAGGLGNWMFMVGAMFGLSRINSRVPVLLEDYWPEKYFEKFQLEKRNRSVLLENLTNEQSGMWERGAGKFTSDMTQMSSVKGSQNVLLIGYLQSWKYFHSYRNEVRSLFTFSQATFQTCLTTIKDALQRFAATNSSLVADGAPALVGIHVRRGDIVHNPSQVAHGHQPASEEYLLRAALHFQRTHFPVLFIVISNDIPYCKKLYKEPNFLFLENNGEAVDIAVLSLMDYIILSVGTYGWWGAYLSDAREVYYFKDWPRNGSDMVNIYNHDDYFLPSWTSFV